LARVKEWEKRKGEIEGELERVWVDGGEELDGPAFVDAHEQQSEGERL
jgi:ATP-binding cassette subfamily D (ALD) long-chain fatty acid import protein